LIRWIGASFAMSVALSACGKKGELELPPAEPAGVEQPSDDGEQ
jgi:predicted small lipoprotein YifL